MLYEWFEDPSSCAFAKFIAIVIMLSIVVSIGVFLTQTVPSIYAVTHPDVWFLFEMVFTIIFTVEYAVRLWVCTIYGTETRIQFIVKLMSIIDFIALVFAGVLFGEVMHWIGLFATCFILEIVGYIIMVIMCAITVLMLLCKKDKWGQQPKGPVTGAAIEMQPTQVHVQPQPGVIVQAAPLQQAKTF